MEIYKKLLGLQCELKSPKTQFNSFGKYSYRSCEDILESLKPLLEKYKLTVILSDEIILIGDRYYLRATVKLIDVEDGTMIENYALAREDETKKGQDLAQVTGSVSSYARKYALNGLFAIDDTKDSDTTNTSSKDTQTSKKPNNSISRVLTADQLEALFELGKKVGYDTATVKKQTLTKFNKEPKDLSLDQYKAVVNGYNNVLKKSTQF